MTFHPPVAESKEFLIEKEETMMTQSDAEGIFWCGLCGAMGGFFLGSSFGGITGGIVVGILGFIAGAAAWMAFFAFLDWVVEKLSSTRLGSGIVCAFSVSILTALICVFACDKGNFVERFKAVAVIVAPLGFLLGFFSGPLSEKKKDPPQQEKTLKQEEAEQD